MNRQGDARVLDYTDKSRNISKKDVPIIQQPKTLANMVSKINTEIHEFGRIGPEKLYQDYHPSYSLLGKKVDEQTIKQIAERNWKAQVENQTIWWSQKNALEQMKGSLSFVNSQAFKDARYLASQEEDARSDERNALKESKEELNTQLEADKSQLEKPSQQADNAKECIKYIEELSRKKIITPNSFSLMRDALYSRNWANYSEKAFNRAKELESLIKDAQKHQKLIEQTIENLDKKVWNLKHDKSDTAKLEGKLSHDEENALQILGKELKNLEKALQDARTKAIEFATVANETKDTFKNSGVKEKEIQGKLKELKGYASATQEAEVKIEDILQRIRDGEQKVVNTIQQHRALIPDNWSQARKCVTECRAENARQAEAVKKELEEPWFPFYADAGRVTLNGKWTDMRLIWNWKYVYEQDEHGELKRDEHGKLIPQFVDFDFRPDCFKLQIETVIRESTVTGKENIYTKTLWGQKHESGRYIIEFQIHDQSFDNEERRQGKVIIIDKDRRDGIIKKDGKDGKEPFKPEEYTTVQYIPLDAVANIKIQEIYNNQSKDAEMVSHVQTETLPDKRVDLRKARTVPEPNPNDPYSPSKTSQMYRLHLMATPPGQESPHEEKVMAIVGPNGNKVELNNLDWTEAIWRDREEGIIFRFKGTSDISRLRALTAFSNEGMGPDGKKLEKNAKKQINDYRNIAMKELEKAINEHNKDKAEELFSQIERHTRLVGFIIDLNQSLYDSLPKDQFQQERSDQSLEDKFALIAKYQQEYINMAEKLARGSIGLNTEIKESMKKDVQGQKWLDADQFNKSFDVNFREVPHLAGTFIMEIAQEAGKAAYKIEKLRTKNTKAAENAQKKVEDAIVHDVEQATITYRDNKEKSSLEALHSAIRTGFHRARQLQAEAQAIKAVQGLAELGESSDEITARDQFIAKAKIDRAKKSGEAIVNSILERLKRAKEAKLQSTSDSKPGNVELRNKARNPAEEVIIKAIKDAKSTNDDTVTQYTKVVKVVKEAAILELGGGQDGENRLKAANVAGKSTYEDPVKRLERELKEAEDDAKQQWQDKNKYDFILAEKTLKEMEIGIKDAQDQAKKTGEDADAAGTGFALSFATIEREKLEVARAQFDASKAQGKDDRAATIDVRNEVKDLESRVNSVNEIAVRAVIREATKKRLWAQAVKTVANSRGAISDAQGLSKTAQSNASSPYDTAIAKEIAALRKFADNAVNIAQGDSNAKDAAWIEAAQHYAAELEKMAESVKTAADEAKTTARFLGQDVAKARQRVAYVVMSLAEAEESCAKGAGTDSLKARVIAAQQASASEIAIAKSERKAAEAAQRGEDFLEDGKPEEAKLRVAQDLKIHSTATGSKIATTSIKTSREQAQDFARRYKQLTHENADTNGESTKAAIKANELITKKIKAIGAPTEAPTPEAGNLVIDLTKAKVAQQWTMVEEAKLAAATANHDIAMARELGKDQQRTAAQEAINYLDNTIISHAVKDKEGLVAGAAAAVAAKEYATLLQAKAKVIQAEKDIIKALGDNTVLVDNLVAGSTGVIDGIYSQEGLEAVVQHAEWRFHVAKFVIQTNEQKGQNAAIDLNTRLPVRLPGSHDDPKMLNLVEGAIPGTKQAITAAVNLVQMIPELARVDQELTTQTDARTAAAERYAVDEVEIVTWATKAGDQKAEILKDSKEAARFSQAKAKVAKYAKDLAIIMGRTNQITADESESLRKINDRFNEGGLVFAERYVEYIAQVAKSATNAADAARSAAPTGQEDIHAQEAAQYVNDRAVAVWGQFFHDPVEQDVKAAIAAAELAESYVQIGKAVQALINNTDGNSLDQKRANAQPKIQALHHRVVQAKNEINANLDPAIHLARYAVRTAQNILDDANRTINLGNVNAQATNANSDNIAIDSDTPATKTSVKDAWNAIQGAGSRAGQVITDVTDKPNAITEYHGYGDKEYNFAIKEANRYNDYQALITASATKAEDAARFAAPTGQEDIHAQAAKTAVEQRAAHVYTQTAGDSFTKGIAAAIAAAELAESYVQINKAVERVIDAEPGATPKASAQPKIQALHGRLQDINPAKNQASDRAGCAAVVAQNIVNGRSIYWAYLLTFETSEQTGAQNTLARDAVRGAAADAEQTIRDAAVKRDTITEYYEEDRDEEHKVAIKAVRDGLVAQKIKVPKDGEAVEKASAAASDTVKRSASEASRDLMRQVETKRVEEWNNDGDPDRIIKRKFSPVDSVMRRLPDITFAEDVSKKALKDIQSKAKENVRKNAENTARLRYGSEIIRRIYVEKSIKRFNKIARNERRMGWIRGGDKIAQNAAVAEAVTAYEAYITQLARDAQAASTDASFIATLAGEDAKEHGRRAVEGVILRADIAQHDAALEHKSLINQYAAAAAGARRFATAQAELRQLSEAADKAAADRARAEKIPEKKDLPPDAPADAPTRETERQKAVKRVIEKFDDTRKQAATKKIQRAKEELVIFAREMAEAGGDGNVQTTVDSILGEPAPPLPDSIKAMEQQAKRDLAYLGNDAAIEEGVAQVVLAQLAIIQAKRNVALSVKASLEVQGITAPTVPPANIDNIIKGEIAHIDAAVGHVGEGNILKRKIKASEIATYMAVKQSAIEIGSKNAKAVTEKTGGVVGPAGIGVAGAGTPYGDAQTTANNIRTVMQGLITYETGQGMDDLTAQKLAAEIGTQLASVQTSRLTAALSRQKAAELAGIPSNAANAAAIANGTAPAATTLEVEVTAAVGGVNAKIANNYVDNFIDVPATTPVGTRNALRAFVKARFALREATAEVKITQAIETYTRKVREMRGKTLADNDPNRANLLNDDGQAAANYLYTEVNAVLTAAGGTLEEALAIVQREVAAYDEIANMIPKVEEYAKNSERIAGGLQPAQDIAARDAVFRLFNVAKNAKNAKKRRVGPGGGYVGGYIAGEDPALAAVQAAQRYVESEAQIVNAIERVRANATGTGTILTNVRPLQNAHPNDFITSARIAARIAENFTQDPPANINATGTAAVAEADKAQRAVEDAGNKIPRTLDTTVTAAREVEVLRELDEVEVVAKNPDVVQAMNDVAKSAQAAKELERADITTPTVAELATEAKSARDASQAVLRSAIRARHVAKAAKLDDNAVKAAESETAAHTATRFVSRYTIAIAAKDMVIEKCGNPYDTVAVAAAVPGTPLANAAAIRTEIREKVQADIGDLDAKLQNEELRKAGLRVVDGKLALVNDNPAAVVRHGFINEAKVAVYQLGKVFGQRGDEQTKAANAVVQDIIDEANQAKQDVQADSGDEWEATLVALTFIAQRVAVEREKSDAALTAWEIAELTKENINEQEKRDKAQNTYKLVEKKYKAAQKIAEDQSLDKNAQVAAGAAAVKKYAHTEKNLRDAILAAKASAGPDKVRQFDAANRVVTKLKKDVQGAKEEVEKEVTHAYISDFIKKYAKASQKIKNDAYNTAVLLVPNPAELPLPIARPAPAAGDVLARQEARAAYNEEIEARNTITKESVTNILKEYKSVIRAANKLGKDTIQANSEAVAAIVCDRSLTADIISVQKAKTANITRPGGGATDIEVRNYNKNLQNIRIQTQETAKKEADDAFDKVEDDYIEKYATKAAAVKKFVLLENAIIKAQEVAEIRYTTNPATPRPVVGAALVGIAGNNATQADVDAYDKRLENIRVNEAIMIRTAADNAQKQAKKDHKSPLEQYAAAAEAAAKASGGNPVAARAAVMETARDVKVVAIAMQDTVRGQQDTFVSSVSAASCARIIAIEEAVKSLTPEQAQEVRDEADRAQKQAEEDKQGLIEQHAKVAEAAVRRAYELQEGITDPHTPDARKALDGVGNKARQAVEAAAVASGADTTKISGGTTIQSATAKNAARCATARATIAQTIKVVGAHVRARVDQVVVATGVAPATPQGYQEFPGISANPVNLGGEARVAYQTRVKAEATKSVANNIMDLADGTIEAKLRDSAGNPIEALEKGADAATAYIVQVVGQDALARNKTAATGAQGLAAFAQRYASKAADRDTVIKNQSASDVDHTLTISEATAIQLAEEEIVQSEIAVSKALRQKENKQDATKALATLKEASKSRKKNDAQKSKETIEAATNMASASTALARDITEVAKSVEKGAKVAGLDVNQVTAERTEEVKRSAIEKQKEVLEAELAKTITEVITEVRDLRNQAPIKASRNMAVNTLDDLFNVVAPNIQMEAKKALDAAKDKDLVTQYTEVIAAVRAQGAIESARIKIITNLIETLAVTQMAPLTANQFNVLPIMIDQIVQEAKTHTGPDIIQQHIAAAVTAKKLASLEEQMCQAIIPLKVNGSAVYNSCAYQGSMIFGLRPNLGITKLSFARSIARLDFAKREALVRANVAGGHAAPTKEQLAEQAKKGLRDAVLAGDTAEKSLIDALGKLKDKADEAYRDGARQRAELGQVFGQTLEALGDLAEEAKYAGKDPDYFGKLVLEIDKQADDEAKKAGKTFDQRIQARITALRQAAIVLPKLAKDIKTAVEASQAIAKAAGRDEHTEAAKAVLDEFTTRRAAITAGGGNLAAALAAGGDAAAQVAEDIGTLKKGTEVLTKHLEGIISNKEQATKDIVENFLNQVNEKKAKNADISLQSIIMEVGLEIRAEAILSTKAIDPTTEEKLQKIENVILVSNKNKNLNPRKALKEYSRYIMKEEAGRKLDSAEQNRYEDIEAFFDDPDNTEIPVHYCNHYKVKRARKAAAHNHFHGHSPNPNSNNDKSASEYIMSLEPVPGPDKKSDEEGYKEEEAMQKWQGTWVDHLRKSLALMYRTGSDNVIGKALADVDYYLEVKDKNLAKCEENASKEISPKKARESLDKIVIPEDTRTDLEGLKKSMVDPREKREWEAMEILNRNYTFKEHSEMTPGEIAKNNEVLCNFFMESAQEDFIRMLKRASTLEAKWKLVEDQDKLLKIKYEGLMKRYENDEQKKWVALRTYELHKHYFKWFWMTVLKEWALLTIQSGLKGAVDGEKAFGDLMAKLLMTNITKA